jgi:hypothetical protein
MARSPALPAVMINGFKRATILMVAMLAGCSAFGSDGPSQDDMRDALTRYGQKVQSTERIACKVSPDKPGYICDFKSTTCSAFTKKCDTSLQRTGRFVQVSGNWMFMGDISDPSRGYIEPTPTPSASASPVVTDLGGTDGNTVAPAATPTAKPSPTPTPTATPTPKPTATPTPKPTPTHSATPTPKATPAGVNRIWLSGRWSGSKGDCAARKAINFGSGGGFYGKHGIGTWSLKGKTVAVTGKYPDTDKPFSQNLAIERAGDDTMTLEGKTYLRCDN